MNVLAIIPARGGSKGIPRKNVRLLAGHPLIWYAVENAKKCPLITEVVVTSDDEEILGICGSYGVRCIRRNSELAADNVTLDAVVYDAVVRAEREIGKTYDVVVTLQATSPLLRLDTLTAALERFWAGEGDSLISVVNKPRLSWGKDERGYFPNYRERLNRQQLPPQYLETGSFLISRRECVTPSSRLGKKVTVFEVSDDEAVDIDAAIDWNVCQFILERKKIVFRVDGFRERGLGHIYHCLTLAYNMTGHQFMFVTRREHAEGAEKIRASFMPLTEIGSDADFFTFLDAWKPDIVVHDCLDTAEEYMKELKRHCAKIVTIEDLGIGARYADIVVNALYHDENPQNNYYFGYKYVCLREEFQISTVDPFREKVRNVLVLFGGTDPCNLTHKIYNLALDYNALEEPVNFHFILGSGYWHEGIVTREDRLITVAKDVKNISDAMRQADMAFTSQGRTVFELACMGVPSIVLAQNEREQLHTFAQMENGFLNLGLGKDLTRDTVELAFRWLLRSPQMRREMRELMLRRDVKRGLRRVVDLILSDDMK